MILLSLDDEINIIKEAENGRQLIDILNDGNLPDVILMDVRMPIMDGVQAAKIVKEKYTHIKVIILTTFNEDEYILSITKDKSRIRFMKKYAKRKDES